MQVQADDQWHRRADHRTQALQQLAFGIVHVLGHRRTMQVEVDDVEAHGGDRGEALGRRGEGARPRGIEGRALGAGEELVPGAVEGARALDPHRPAGLERAIESVLASGIRTPDLGGSHGTSEVTDAIISAYAAAETK